MPTIRYKETDVKLANFDADDWSSIVQEPNRYATECGPMPNVMAALPNMVNIYLTAGKNNTCSEFLFTERKCTA